MGELSLQADRRDTQNRHKNIAGDLPDAIDGEEVTYHCKLVNVRLHSLHNDFSILQQENTTVLVLKAAGVSPHCLLLPHWYRWSQHCVFKLL